MSFCKSPGGEAGALVVYLREDEAQALAAMACRLSRSKLNQYRVASDKDQARRMASALDAIRESLLASGVEIR